MNRKLVFAAAMIGLGTLAGCSRTDNPLAPAAHRPAYEAAPLGPDQTTTTASAGTAPADSTSELSTTGEAIYSQGGN